MFLSIGKSHAAGNKSLQMSDPLGFLIHFAQVDFDSQTPGQWLDLRWQLLVFLKVPMDLGPFPLNLSPDDAAEFGDHRTTESYRRVQSALRQALDEFVAARGAVGEGAEPAPSPARFLFRPTCEAPKIYPQDSPEFLTFQGKVEWLAWFQATLILRRDGSGRVLKCPFCGTIFIRVRRQRYCSIRCRDKVSMARWMADPKNKRKHRESSKRNYERRRRKLVSPKVKIGRQPKGGK